MSDLTRRGFLKRGAAAGAVSVGGLAVGPGLAAAVLGAAGLSAAELAKQTNGEPVVAYVRDAASGEVAVIAGEKEIAVHDPELVRRLLKASHR